MTLESSVGMIKGVGQETAKKLALLGVATVYDLLTFWPRRYDDYSQVLEIKEIRPGAVTVRAHVESVKGRRVRRGTHITEAVLRDDGSAVRAVWFNQPYREKYFNTDQEYYFSGLYDYSYNRFVLQNPSVEQVSEFTKNTARIVPIYHQTKGLDSREIRKILAEVTKFFDDLPETLPRSALKSQKMSFTEAARQMHWPESQEKLTLARERIGFEEIFSYILAGLMNKKQVENETALRIEFDKDLALKFTGRLPFELTPAQKQSAWEILQDIDKEIPMNRLLEGDVGAGKTAVAAFAAFIAAKQGIQTAVMAPTELLASQHAVTLDNLLKPLGISIGLLTSAIKKPAKAELKKQLAVGKVDIVIGTHALLQEDVSFKRLGFIVVDEQHRFGVKQRQKLVDKADKIPHILSMTATPIPRSLALTVYGELEISIIAQKPKNRLPIRTYIWSPNSREQMYKEIDAEIEGGRQAYVVCPLIDESDTSGAKSVIKEQKLLQKGVFKHRQIGLLHGKMKDEEKSAVMKDFLDKKLDILVSTTVIEVGIDVPNASVILIEGADQFGLAQLHQLRGRVGRAEHQSYCYLMQSDSKAPSQRLRAMETTQNGFKLAEMDLELRGPGAIYGTRQHGKLDLKIANITNTQLIKKAKTAAEAFLNFSDKLEDYPALAQHVERNRSLTYLN